MKISRPVLWLAVAGVAAYAGVLLTEPDAPAKKQTTKTVAKAAAAPDGFTPEDLTAHFPRYTQQAEKPFQPKVISARSAIHVANTNQGRPAPSGQLTLPGEAGSWQLTGVSAINNVPSALLENGKSEESVFLHMGDTWHGLRVVSLESEAIVFENVLGQKTRLPFVDPTVVPEPGTPGAAGKLPAGVPGVPGAPSPVPTKILSSGADVPSRAADVPGVNAPASVTIEDNSATVQPTTRRGRRGRNVN